MAAAALAPLLLLLLVAAQVQGAEVVNGFTCPSNQVTLTPGANLGLAANHLDDTTYILTAGDYTINNVAPIRNTAALCYIGQGNVTVRVTAAPIFSEVFQPLATLAVKGLTLDGQQQALVGAVAIFLGSGALRRLLLYKTSFKTVAQEEQ